MAEGSVDLNHSSARERDSKKDRQLDSTFS